MIIIILQYWDDGNFMVFFLKALKVSWALIFHSRKSKIISRSKNQEKEILKMIFRDAEINSYRIS